MHYEIRGIPDSSAPPILFLNGLSQSTLAWHPLLAAGLEKHATCLLVDLLFQGKSDEDEKFRSFEAHATDVYALLQHLGIQRVVLVGISYGGAVGQRLMQQYPEVIAQAFLLATFGEKNPFFNFIGAAWKQALLQGGYPLLFDVMLPWVLGKTFLTRESEKIALLRSDKSAMSPSPQRLLLLMEATAKSSESFYAHLQDCPVPTQVIHGEEDLLCTPEMGSGLRRLCPKGNLPACRASDTV
ncbi:PcaD [Nitritalea halalkaliphila LW7]|uniref:PcaD n=2 Tax=Nitritalea TaxID=1187887 RepID=I5C8C0_9BACT|nr:PcaD [Nitritalea halalkaliphila LW7]